MRHRGIEKDFAVEGSFDVTVDYKGKVAFITGAAHGFGEVFAREAVARGMKLALFDIGCQRLGKTYQRVKKSRGRGISYSGRYFYL